VVTRLICKGQITNCCLYGLLNGGVSSSDYMASNDMINE
jgi:hypothetical protein